jgi:uncharacterized repeat protein (TIGR01451 family)/fimbrial isopeptide formation D2 family protein
MPTRANNNKPFVSFAIACIALLLGGRAAWAAPVATATVTTPLSEFIGEAFTTQACFDNAGDATGFQPIFELITPAGVTFASATYLGAGVSASPAQTCSTPAGCTFTNPDTNTTVSVANGETFRVLRYPLGSFTIDQPAQCMDLNFALGNSPTVQLGVAKNLKVTPAFSLGKDALDNPGTDPPIFGTQQPIVVNPAVIKHEKTVSGGDIDNETATGPNYTRTVTLTVDVATGETVNPVTVTDVLPPQFQFVAVTGTAGCAQTATPSTSTPGGTLTLNCGSITGVTGIDKTITFTFYIPQSDAANSPVLNATTPNPASITNSSSASGTYQGSPLAVVNASDSIVAKAVALQKTGTIFSDTGPTGLTPGDTVEYTLTGNVSDYFTVGNLTVTDTLGDGQTYLGSFTPTVALQSNGSAVAATDFQPSEFTVAGKDASGRTLVTFNLSAAITRLIAGSGGQLVGDNSGGLGQGPTTLTIKLRSTVDNAYSGPVAPGTATLSAGDTVSNNSGVTFQVSGGGTVADTSSSSLTVGTPAFTKAKYALNGNTTLPNPFLVAAGDTVTYRLTTTLPVSSIESFKLIDYLPIPLYSVPATLTDAGPCAGGGTPTSPAENAWCYTGADTISGTAPPVTVSTDTGLNRITWDYGTRETPTSGGNIDILYTLRVTTEPMADKLSLANLAIQSYRDSLSGSDQTAAVTQQVTTKEPQLAIKKEITAVSHGAIAGTPTAGYDAEAQNLDAGDTVTYRVRVTNTGSAPAFGIRVTDNAGTLTPTPFSACTAPATTLGDGSTSVATSGSLSAGLTITPSLAGNGDGAVQTSEEIWITYTCTLAGNATPRTTDIDNTAALQYYTNIDPTSPPPGLTPTNFATNTALLTRKAKVKTQGIQSIAKAITASSVPGSTPNNNINNGETLTFQITATLSEGVYDSFSLTDNNIGPTSIPINCADPQFTCTNVSVSGSQITVGATSGSTPGVITYTYSQAKTASGSNTASVSATNAPAQTATATWTMDDPNPAITKTLSPAGGVNAGDTVQVRLGWSNTDSDNPMFRCVVTDVLDANVFDLATVTEVTTPTTDYTFAYSSGTVTYTANNLANPCPTVAAGGAVFSVKIKNSVVTGSYSNTATLSTYTLPTTGGGTVTASAVAPVPIGAPSISGKTVTGTSLADTAGSNVAIGEIVTYRLVFRMAEGVTNSVKLIDQLFTGTSTAQLVYIPGTAQLSRNSLSISAANNPGGINTAAINTPVPVTPALSGSNLTVDLGNVTNSSASGGDSEIYTLEAQFRVDNVTANTAGKNLQNRPQLTYRPASATADQTVSGSTVTVKVVAPQVAVSKTVSPAAAAGGDTVTYTLTVRNSATGANAAPAYDYAFGDTLPAGTTPTGTPTANVGTTGATVSGLGFSGQTLSGTIDKLDPGETVTITYQTRLSATVPFGKMLVNSASATATSLPGSDANERTGSGSGPNNLFAGANATVTTQTVTMTKAIKNPKPFYAIGEEIDYELRVSLPVGSATGMTVRDTLPTGLSHVTGSAAITIAGGVTSPSAGPITPTSTSPLTFTLGTVSANPAGEAVISYRVKVDNIIANQDGAALTNSALVSYDNPNPNGTTPLVYTAPNPPTARIGEPNLEMTKSILAGATGAQAGSIVRWQFTASNIGNTAARQVAISDVLPGNTAAEDKLTIPASPNITVTVVGGVSKETGGAVTASDFSVSDTNRARDTLSATGLVLEPGATLTVAFDTVVGTNAAAGESLDNRVAADYNSLPVGGSGGRDGSGGPTVDDDNNGTLNNYRESASHALQIQSRVTIDKQVTPVRAAIGEIVTYQLRIDVIQGVTNSVVVTDVLPAGLDYVGHAISVGNIGMAFNNPDYNTNLGSGQIVSFDLGDVLNPANASSDDDYVLVEIFGRVRNIASNQNNTIIANGEAAGSPVTVSYNDGSPQTVNFDHDATTPGNQGVPFTVIEPVLGVTKSANPTAQALGDIVTYTLNISHQPSSTADAYDVVLVDTIPVGLTYIPGSVNPPPAFVSFDAGTRRLTLGYDSLPLAEGSRAITYQAQVDNSATVGAPLSNSVTMTWTSQSGATGAPDGGRTGADGTGGALNDYATTTGAAVTPTASAAIYAAKTVAIAVDSTPPAGVANPGDVLEYTVVLTNSGSSTVNDVVFTDPIPALTTHTPYPGNVAAKLTRASVTSDTGSVAGGILTVTVGALVPGESVTIKFQVTINSGVANGVVIRNQGSVDSDETVPKPTDGDGNPSNGDQPTDIPVGGQPPLTGALYAEKTVAWTDTDNSSTVNAGDALRYTIALRNRGAATLTGLSFSDTIPTDLTYVAASATATSGAATITGQDVGWTGIADLAPGTSQTLRFDVTIGAISGASQTFVNQGTATSTQTGPVRTDSNGDPSDGTQPTTITAIGTGTGGTPALDLQKRWSLAVDGGTVGQVDPGDTVQYTLTATNTGVRVVADVRLTDAPLPTQFTYVPGSLATSTGAVVTETPIAVNIGTLNPGQTATVSFRMTVNPGTNGQIASNQATATAASGISVTSDDNGNPADGRNPTLTPIGPVAPSGLSKSLVSTSNGLDTNPAVQIGEVLTYRLQFDVPAGTTGEVTMIDTLPAGLSYVASSAQLARVFATGLTASQNPGGINGALSGSFVGLADGAEVAINGSTVSVFLGNVINSDSNPATTESYILELQARVDNVAGNQAGAALNNQAGLSYRNAAGQLGNLTPVTQTATVAEPNLQIAKTADVNAVLANTASTVRFTLTLTNPAGANVSTAYDVSVSDALPVGFASATLVSTVPSGGMTGAGCAFVGTTLNCGADVFPPGGQLVVTYDAVTTATLAEGSSLTNNAAALWSSLPGGDPFERTGDGGVNDYASASGVTIRVGTPALVKSVVNPQARYAIGDEVTYRVVLSFPGTLNNVSFQDVLPEGLTYVSSSLTLNYGAGLSSAGNPTDFSRTDNAPAAGQETLALAFGTMTNNSGAVRTLTLTYRALVDNILSNQDGQTLPNTAGLTYDRPSVGGSATVSDSKTVTVGEPHLAVTHTITSPTTNLDAGDTVNYQVTVTNNGTTPSFETTLRDLLPPGLGNVQGISVVLTNTSGNSETPTITVLPDGWQSSPFDLQPGDVVTIVFTATLQNTVQPGQTLQARVDSTYSSRDGADSSQRDGSTTGSSQDDNTALNNYNVATPSPTFTVGDPVALNKAFYPNPAKTAYSVGETVTYRLTLTLSEGTVNGVTATDTLPAGLTFLDATVGAGNTGITTGYGGAPTPSGQTLTFALGSVVNPANGSATDDFLTIDIRARADNIVANQDGVVLGNAAQLGFTDGAGTPQTRDFDADASTPGNQPLDFTVVEPNLTLDKSAAPAQPSLGDEVTFTLLLDHTAASTADAFDLAVSDQLPVGLSYVAGSASLAPSSVSPDGRTLAWTIASLTRATDHLTISYRARVSPGAVVGVGLANAASLRYASTPGATGAADSGRNGSGGLNDYAATDTATVAPTAAAVIGATKTVRDLNGGSALPGDVLEYSVTLTNTSGDAVSDVVFTDPIPANTEYVAGSSTLNGSPAGSFANDTLTVNVGTLNPGASAAIAFRVRINPGTPSGIIISNQGVVDSDQTVPTPTDADGDPSNGAQPTTTPVGGTSGDGSLRAEKRVALLTDTAPTGVVSGGDVLRYTIVLSNTGATALAGLTLSDPVPAGLSYVAGSANPTATLAGATLTWSNLSVPAGGSLTLRFDVTVDPFTEAERVFNNQGTVSSPQIGSVSTDGNGDPGDGAQPTVIAAANGNGAPQIDLQKRWSLAGNVANGSAVNPGDILLYTLIVSNTGSAVANDVRVVDDPLPPQVTLIPGSVLTSRGGVVSETPITVNVGNLNPGELATISFRVTVNANTGGQTASNQATATAANAPTGVVSDDDGNPANGRDPTLTPILDVVDIPTLSPAALLALLGLLLALGWRYVGQSARARGMLG